MSSNRNSIKVFGCIDITQSKFLYRFEEDKFNADTYIIFLEKIVAKNYYRRKIIYIQDNAPYHKNKIVWAWFKENEKWIFVKNLPPYCPELNATECIWHHTRMEGVHNHYFDSKDEIRESLQRVFKNIQKNPNKIQGYINPFL